MTIDTTLKKTPWEPIERVIRDTSKLNKETLEKFYTAPDIDNNTSLEQACDWFHEELCKMLDRVAPQKKVQYADRPQATETLVQQICQWIEENCYKQGSNLQKHRGNDHWRAYTIERNKYNRLLKFHKRQIITKQIIDNS